MLRDFMTLDAGRGKPGDFHPPVIGIQVPPRNFVVQVGRNVPASLMVRSGTPYTVRKSEKEILSGGVNPGLSDQLLDKRMSRSNLLHGPFH